MKTIIVGYDGSEPAHEALRWAYREADLRGWPLRTIQSWRDPALALSPIGAASSDATAERRRVELGLLDQLDALGSAHPDVEVTSETTNDRPAVALEMAADDEDLIVVGARGRGGFLGLDLGSVSSHVAREADCPVAVVRQPEPEHRHGPVVVGVDGTEVSRLALRWAADEALLRDAPLHVVMAWSYLVPEGVDGAEVFRPNYSAEEATGVVREIVESELGDLAEKVTMFAPCDLASDALLQRTIEAQLLVVGARGSRHRGPFGLGSVSQQVVRHASCPVVVVRQPDVP
jgi:nucleotide-binding universal stress UspA family protein